MVKSIQHFSEISIGVFDKIITDFYKNPTDMASFVTGITNELHKVGLLLIEETLEEMDQMICKSGKRRREWVIEKHLKDNERKELLTSLGTVRFSKTLFTNKETGESCFLLDRILGLEKNERITEDAEARMLEEAVQTSYRRGGENTSLTDSVSKQTVMNKIHRLEFPQGWKAPTIRKVADYLYIEADEDHIALQYREHKGDLVRTENGSKNNNAITKLIYVHEGIEPEAPKSKRNKLISPHYFSRTAEGCSNRELWDNVYRYIEETYDLEHVKRIYLSSDGGGWITAGRRQISGLIHVLDRYHLEKHLTKLTGHLKENSQEARKELYRQICRGTKQDFARYVQKLKESLPEGYNLEKYEDSEEYILNNWTAARYRLVKMEGKVGSSTEGHVSHVLSSRMSTQALGWSLIGADKMAQLRAYYLNGGDMLELVRYQKEELPMAAGGEGESYLSASEMQRSEKSKHREIGKYVDAMSHHLSDSIKKKAVFQYHIWGI